MSQDILTDKERIAVLEAEHQQLKEDILEIKAKLDQLLSLRDKGMGAIGLVGLIIGSGVIGLAFTLWNMLKGSNHL